MSSFVALENVFGHLYFTKCFDVMSVKKLCGFKMVYTSEPSSDGCDRLPFLTKYDSQSRFSQIGQD